MKHQLSIINAFLEDSCVIVVIAYLLARGRVLALLSKERRTARETVLLGALLGAGGLTEVIFPGGRAPFVVHSLLIAFAGLTGGVTLGATAIVVVLIGVLVFGGTAIVPVTALILGATALTAAGVRRLRLRWNPLVTATITGVAAQSVVVSLHYMPIYGPNSLFHAAAAPVVSVASVTANGFGLLLLQLILIEARARAAGQKAQIELERSHTLVAQAQLAALRARVHPHFLFNSLTSIAALCRIAPGEAEKTVIHLSRLMRRTLETNSGETLTIEREMALVRSYLEIEQRRLGDRMQVVWDLEKSVLGCAVPAFSIQTLVENAVIHGAAPVLEPTSVRIVLRRLPKRVVVCVCDTGAGMSSETLRAARAQAENHHGLSIVQGQLQILYGSRHRLRIWNRPDKGVLVAFSIPFTGEAGPGETE